MGWIFLGYVWGFKNDIFTFVVASQSLLSRWMGCLKFCVFSVFYFRSVGFYLGRGVTWVECFNRCGLPGLICFNELTFAYFTLYLCSGGTWVHVVAEKDFLKLI